MTTRCPFCGALDVTWSKTHAPHCPNRDRTGDAPMTSDADQQHPRPTPPAPTTTYPDRHPLCIECLALADPVTGLSPRCAAHQPEPRIRRGRPGTGNPLPFTGTPERLPAERKLDQAREGGQNIPAAHDFRTTFTP